ncbi:hypothetical protein [Agrobacterium vitis]|uniref:hypothetical protein n=1 Tax=Agrobacterium vitis TaxID=373 RepID=UPI001F33F984|nr:hypothetical protein [Agrobacterium vitis]
MLDFTAHVALGEGRRPLISCVSRRSDRDSSRHSPMAPPGSRPPRAFAVQPTFPLKGPFHIFGQPRNVRGALAGVFADTAPDSWGCRLLDAPMATAS